MQPALIVSLIAVAISLASLLWQFARSRWERPVVVVSGLVVALPNALTSDEEFWIFQITIVNVGERAVTLTRWGWKVDGFFNDAVSRSDSAPEFPIRLEPHDTRSWTSRMPFEGNKRYLGSPAIPYVTAVVRPSILRRRYRSGVQEVTGTPVEMRRLFSPPETARRRKAK